MGKIIGTTFKYEICQIELKFKLKRTLQTDIRMLNDCFQLLILISLHLHVLPLSSCAPLSLIDARWLQELLAKELYAASFHAGPSQRDSR